MGRNGANDAKIHGDGGLCKISFCSKFGDNQKENKHCSMVRNEANIYIHIYMKSERK
jgi:hypothetical protein